MFRSFTGLDLLEFDSLYRKVASRYNEFEFGERRLARTGRKRQLGAGRPFKLELQDRLLTLFVYYGVLRSSSPNSSSTWT